MRRRGKPSGAALAGGAVYALLASFGWQAEHWGRSRTWLALAAAALLFVPFVLILDRLFARTASGQTEHAARPFCAGRAWLAMAVCYLPSLAVHFPGSFAYDVPYQLEQVASGAYSTHHPLLHTLFLGGCVNLGRRLGSASAGAALYTALQMALLAGCFALTCASLSRQSGARAARLACAFFALYPLHMLMAVNATKDVLFSGCFALSLALVREVLCCGGLSPRRQALLAGACALSVLLRNNMAYALGAFAAFLLLAGRRKPAVFLALTLACGVGFNALLASALGAVPGDPREMLSWPIQQIARVSCLEREKLTDAEKEAVDDLLPQMVWKQYDPTVSDPVKFGFRTERLKADPAKYASLCVKLLQKCPQCSLDAVLMLTHAFLYPYGRYGVSGAYLQTGIREAAYTGWAEGEGITDMSLAPRLREAIAWRFGARGAMQIPGVGWLFNLGAIIWLMIYLILRAFARGVRGEGLAALWPVLLLGTFLLGPVMAGRYV